MNLIPLLGGIAVVFFALVVMAWMQGQPRAMWRDLRHRSFKETLGMVAMCVAFLWSVLLSLALAAWLVWHLWARLRSLF